MRISAKSDYALRALLHLAAHPDELVSSEQLAGSQQIPHKFLEAIMSELRQSRFVTSQRGTGGGHRLCRPANEIPLADVLRALNGPLVTVRGECPQDLDYVDRAENLQLVWVAARAALRRVLESVSLQDILDRRLPDFVQDMLDMPDAWESRVVSNTPIRRS
ncbi:RrF2 family transcriptional regulator [Nocardia sp. alder85J]|uniref:RrF2 family transcriptional regulator n=1 Tax=Nocardia sp. alder85J TaxID=2862949 RepID=UPI001CD531BC|nr:Rrf2 family transcriptional regulator [Nocardia sp. alder85J]MCX4098180.1 Rrf2 family transcriptional regulator [Nocardia sp. alder85J]